MHRKSTAPDVHLYNLTLQKTARINQAVHGNFAGTKQQLIVVGRGKILELLKPDSTTGNLTSLCVTEIYGVVRSLQPFRLTGGNKDYLVVGTDSGRITVLEYDTDTNLFKKVHQETFGKSGCRRIVPGQYLAADPKGRAVMIGAFEKQKLVYIFNRDAAAHLTISSPLEAHKSHTIVYDTVGVDVGFDNPIFACLEVDYEEVDEDPTGEARQFLTQSLTFYELDLGLNHVVRKESIPLDEFANKLVSVPGGSDGPGGVLVCSPGRITWRTYGEHEPVAINLPRRDDPLRTDRAPLVTAVTMHKTKRMFFFLVQTEEGDLFKLTMVAEKGEVSGLIIKYFDTVPVANAMCLLRNGLLFVAAEYGNHHLYQIASLGDNEDEPSYLSIDPLDKIHYFRPRDLLNLALVDDQESLHPMIACQLADLHEEETPQLYALCGRGAKSSFRVLRHGLEVSEVAVSELPGNPSAVWSVKRHVDDESDTYLVLSFVDKTLVLGIGETVEEVKDSGFLEEVPTLSASRIGDDSLLQVYPGGIRHIRFDQRVKEWKAPGSTAITNCAVNERQVVITLSSNELVYFELDRAGQLNEYTERIEMTSKVTAMALAPVAEDAFTSQFLALGLEDNTVRVLSLDPSSCLQPLRMQALPGAPSSLCIIEIAGQAGEPGTLQLHIGLANGVVSRSTMDKVTGDLSDSRTRYLGVREVRLFPVRAHGHPAVLALSTRPWIAFTYQGQPRMAPLSYEALEYAHMFCSEQLPEGIVAVAKNTLRILSLQNLGSIFNQSTIPLAYTPRKFFLDEKTAIAVIIEGDQATLTAQEKKARLSGAAKKEEGDDDMMVDDDDDMMVDDDDEASKPNGDAAPSKPPLDVQQFGEPRVEDGRWASQIRVVDAKEGKTLQTVQLAQDEMLTSICKMQFTVSQGFTHVIVGGVRGWDAKKNTFASAFIDTYLFSAPDGSARLTKLDFVHRTEVEAMPCALTPFAGRLIAGVGNIVRIYDMGRKKLLRKCENKHLPSRVVDIEVMGTRVVVADQRESVFFLKYKPTENVLSVFCDDTTPRWCTAMLMVDYSTVCVADKFGNVSVLRCPDDVTDTLQEDPSGAKAFWARGYLNGAPQKLVQVANFYIGEIVQSLHKTTLTPSGTECIAYTTLSGSIGALMPFSHKEDAEFFQTLELHLRQEHPPICGRDHLAFRSAYVPCKSVIDGDLCEEYNMLSASLKSDIADGLERTPQEVAKKLEEFRTRYAF
ncbi:splicing factor 3b subunit 3 [Salpingoeca rosetta]|uniref:Splicing factor 3b subunit 3 n=1 Tax=Salpingoeca rosetta (strain ATCC 50818 / BSB-021) TaxID=946362 RepID=F2ULE1_SALR5|nr:splicing factor 3b subunit 3 [Salpingoeca rosetta]EGD77940.1 splicing factor 3b subunit 3 [Salpingoeca rosetta]|eukprot:XP_004990003.1 splicing factor 3b subunit 3 [Salpingoeca rosetta]